MGFKQLLYKASGMDILQYYDVRMKEKWRELESRVI